MLAKKWKNKERRVQSGLCNWLPLESCGNLDKMKRLYVEAHLAHYTVSCRRFWCGSNDAVGKFYLTQCRKYKMQKFFHFTMQESETNIIGQ